MFQPSLGVQTLPISSCILSNGSNTPRGITSWHKVNGAGEWHFSSPDLLLASICLKERAPPDFPGLLTNQLQIPPKQLACLQAHQNYGACKGWDKKL